MNTHVSPTDIVQEPIEGKNEFHITFDDVLRWQDGIVDEAIHAPLNGQRSCYAICTQVRAMYLNPGAFANFEQTILNTYYMVAAICRCKNTLQIEVKTETPKVEVVLTTAEKAKQVIDSVGIKSFVAWTSQMRKSDIIDEEGAIEILYRNHVR